MELILIVLMFAIFVFQGEIKIDVSLEDDNNRDLPSAVELYRVIRQHVYAILFDLGKKKAANKSSQNSMYFYEYIQFSMCAS